MPTEALAGKSGWLKISGTAYPFREWNLRMTATRIDITNFLSGGYSEFIAGFASGTVRARGFLVRTLQLALGQVFTAGSVSLGCGGGLAVTFGGTLMDLSASTAVDKATELEIEIVTNGYFDTVFAPA